MTNRELIQKCTGQCCPICSLGKECDKFRKKNNDLIPEEVGAKLIGRVMETADGRIFNFDKDFLEREVGE